MNPVVVPKFLAAHKGQAKGIAAGHAPEDKARFSDALHGPAGRMQKRHLDTSEHGQVISRLSMRLADTVHDARAASPQSGAHVAREMPVDAHADDADLMPREAHDRSKRDSQGDETTSSVVPINPATTQPTVAPRTFAGEKSPAYSEDLEAEALAGDERVDTARFEASPAAEPEAPDPGMPETASKRPAQTTVAASVGQPGSPASGTAHRSSSSAESAPKPEAAASDRAGETRATSDQAGKTTAGAAANATVAETLTARTKTAAVPPPAAGIPEASAAAVPSEPATIADHVSRSGPEKGPAVQAPTEHAATRGVSVPANHRADGKASANAAASDVHRRPGTTAASTVSATVAARAADATFASAGSKTGGQEAEPAGWDTDGMAANGFAASARLSTEAVAKPASAIAISRLDTQPAIVDGMAVQYASMVAPVADVDVRAAARIATNIATMMADADLFPRALTVATPIESAIAEEPLPDTLREMSTSDAGEHSTRSAIAPAPQQGQAADAEAAPPARITATAPSASPTLAVSQPAPEQDVAVVPANAMMPAANAEAPPLETSANMDATRSARPLATAPATLMPNASLAVDAEEGSAVLPADANALTAATTSPAEADNGSTRQAASAEKAASQQIASSATARDRLATEAPPTFTPAAAFMTGTDEHATAPPAGAKVPQPQPTANAVQPEPARAAIVDETADPLVNRAVGEPPLNVHAKADAVSASPERPTPALALTSNSSNDANIASASVRSPETGTVQTALAIENREPETSTAAQARPDAVATDVDGQQNLTAKQILSGENTTNAVADTSHRALVADEPTPETLPVRRAPDGKAEDNSELPLSSRADQFAKPAIPDTVEPAVPDFAKFTVPDTVKPDARILSDATLPRQGNALAGAVSAPHAQTPEMPDPGMRHAKTPPASALPADRHQEPEPHAQIADEAGDDATPRSETRLATTFPPANDLIPPNAARAAPTFEAPAAAKTISLAWASATNIAQGQTTAAATLAPALTGDAMTDSATSSPAVSDQTAADVPAPGAAGAAPASPGVAVTADPDPATLPTANRELPVAPSPAPAPPSSSAAVVSTGVISPVVANARPSIKTADHSVATASTHNAAPAPAPASAAPALQAITSLAVIETDAESLTVLPAAASTPPATPVAALAPASPAVVSMIAADGLPVVGANATVVSTAFVPTANVPHGSPNLETAATLNDLLRGTRVDAAIQAATPADRPDIAEPAALPAAQRPDRSEAAEERDAKPSAIIGNTAAADSAAADTDAATAPAIDKSAVKMPDTSMLPRLGVSAASVVDTLTAHPAVTAAVTKSAPLRLAPAPSVSSTTHSLQIQLRPDGLGTVTATLRMADDRLTVELATERIEAYEQLNKDSDAIVKSLKGLGLQVDQVAVLPPQVASTNAKPEGGLPMQTSGGREQQFTQAGNSSGGNADGQRATASHGGNQNGGQPRPAAQPSHENRSGGGLVI